MDFNEFLISAGKVQDKQVKYFLIWVSKYNAYKKRYQQSSDQEYFNSLLETHQDWQVAQAKKAVNFCRYYQSVYAWNKTTETVVPLHSAYLHLKLLF